MGTGFGFDVGRVLCSATGSLYRMNFWGAAKKLKRFRVLRRITFEGDAGGALRAVIALAKVSVTVRSNHRPLR